MNKIIKNIIRNIKMIGNTSHLEHESQKLKHSEINKIFNEINAFITDIEPNIATQTIDCNSTEGFLFWKKEVRTTITVNINRLEFMRDGNTYFISMYEKEMERPDLFLIKLKNQLGLDI